MPDLVVVDLGAPVVSGGPSFSLTGTCTTTGAEVINQTRRLLLTNRREQVNQLDANISAGATSLTLRRPVGAVADGTRLSIGLEHYRVWGTPVGQVVEVEPAVEGTAPASHDAGDLIRVNPRQSDWDILNAANDVLRELSSPGAGLFAVQYVDLAYDPNLLGYNLNALGLTDIIDVFYRTPSDQQLLWKRVPRRGWRLQREAVAADFPSALSLTFFNRFGANDGATIRVSFKSTYGALSAYADVVETVTGLQCEAHDLLWIGAALRLTDSREIERNQTFSQGEPRRAGEVPPGAVQASYSGLQRRWQQRLSSEASRLARYYPTFLR